MSKFLDKTDINIFNQTQQNFALAKTKNLRENIFTAKNAPFNQTSDEVRNRLNLAPTYKQLFKSSDSYKNITASDIKLLPEKESQLVVNFLKKTANKIHKNIIYPKLRKDKETKKEKLLECLKILDTIIEVKPNNDWLHFDRGLCQLDFFSLDSKSNLVSLNLAIEDFTVEISLGKIKKNKEQIYDSLYQRAKCYDILGLESKSLHDIQNAIEISANDDLEFAKNAKELEKSILEKKSAKEGEAELKQKKEGEAELKQKKEGEQASYNAIFIIIVFSVIAIYIVKSNQPRATNRQPSEPNRNSSASNNTTSVVESSFRKEEDAKGMLKTLVNVGIVDSGFLDEKFINNLHEQEKTETLKLFDILQEQSSDNEKFSKIKDYLKSKLDEESSLNQKSKETILDNFSNLEEMTKTINLNGRQKNYLYDTLLKNNDSQNFNMDSAKLLEVRKNFIQECGKALKEDFQNEISTEETFKKIFEELLEEGLKAKIENSQTLEDDSSQIIKNEQNDLENVGKKEELYPNKSPRNNQATKLLPQEKIKTT